MNEINDVINKICSPNSISYIKPQFILVCMSALIPHKCLIPSLNASSLLECLLKQGPAKGGPEASSNKKTNFRKIKLTLDLEN